MSLRKEVLNEIKKMLNEVDDGQPLPPEQQSTSECPAGMIKTGSGSNDGTKPICRYPTAQEKAGMEMGEKAGKFIGDMEKSARQGIQQGIQKGLDWLSGYQSKGICPPGMEQTGEGPNGPLCSPKDTGTKTTSAVCKLPEIRAIQQLYNKQMDAQYQGKNKIKEDGVLGKNTNFAIKFLAGLSGVSDNLIPKSCNRKAYAQLLSSLSGGQEAAPSTNTLAVTPLGIKDQSSLVLKKLQDMKIVSQNVAGAKAAIEAELGTMRRKKVPITEKEIDVAIEAARKAYPDSFSSISSLEESWAVKNRNKYSNNLFERLVKDASKNRII